MHYISVKRGSNDFDIIFLPIAKIKERDFDLVVIHNRFRLNIETTYYLQQSNLFYYHDSQKCNTCLLQDPVG